MSYGEGELGRSVEDQARSLEDQPGNGLNFMLKGEMDGRIVAVCTLGRAKRPRVRHTAELSISVAKSHWGRGVARRVCLAMMQIAKDAGVTKVDLRVREDNARAVSLYEGMGFAREGLSPRAMKLQDAYFADVFMGICLD